MSASAIVPSPAAAFTAAAFTAAAPDHTIRTLPILVLSPHNRCNCRCLMCDIWRIRQVREITPRDLEPHRESIRALQVRWVVFSGGEPQMHSDLAGLGRLLRGDGIRVTLLTAGLLLKSQAASVVQWVDDVIVSLDGPRDVHNEVRGIVKAFELLSDGVAALRQLRPGMIVRGRCTVQKANHASLRATVQAARQLSLNSISFLAADLTSEAFNRPGGWGPQRQSAVALTPEQVDQLEGEMRALVAECAEDIASGFIVENPGKLGRIVRHFRAHLGQVPAVAPSCKAPWVSSVVEADGTVRPCFFHPPLGNIHEQTLWEILNSERALEFRRQLDVAADPVCQKCVCSLHLTPDQPLAATTRPDQP